jgi:hypothetical protein
MEIQQILIFAFLGAVVLTVVAGGLWSMMDLEPSTEILSTSAFIGGSVGSVAAYLTDAKIPATSVLLEHVPAMIGGGSTADMKVGLPDF